MIRLKRAYETAGDEDGLRILVDRLWPRGLSKAAADIDLWFKDIAPSPALRTWFGHAPARWQEFRRKYSAELREHPEHIDRMLSFVNASQVTFVYAAKDAEHNHALVLKAFIERACRAQQRLALTQRG